MNRLILLAGTCALALPALAVAQPPATSSDPSNPAAAPLSPSQEAINQPVRGDDSPAARAADAAPPIAAPPETEEARLAREAAAKPKPKGR